MTRAKRTRQDLVSRRVALESEWHPRRNGTLEFHRAPVISAVRRWWRCAKDRGHEWQATISNRLYAGAPCPFCPKLTNPKRSLLKRQPVLASEWHPTKNGPFTPAHVSTSSRKMAWWRCRAAPEHVWEFPIYLRAKGSRCPFCITPGESVADALPQLVHLWHPTKNGERTPWNTPVRSRMKIWWRCPQGPDHEWEQATRPRKRAKPRCPFCTNRQVSITNCLATVHPDVAWTWHPTLNGRLTPQDVTFAARKRVWWQCRLGHTWATNVFHRTQTRSGCPSCWRLENRPGR